MKRNYFRMSCLAVVAVLAVASACKGATDGLPVRNTGHYAIIDTERGTIVLELYPESAPKTVANFETLHAGHGLLLDVTVDQHGQMVGYQILSGPTSVDLRHQLDQMLLFSRFRPMLSFGRPTAGGHVILSFSAVRVRG